MPKHKLPISLTAAAVLCSATLPALSGSGITASAAEQTSADPVAVIVTVTGEAALSSAQNAEQGAEFLATEEAAELTAALTETQQRVQERIRKLYPELEIGYSYDVLLNGFSCTLPENLIDMVSRLPEVESVSVVTTSIVPKMSEAAADGGFPAYYDMTGCTGEGQVVAVIDSELDLSNPMFSAIDDKNVALTEESIAEIANTIGFTEGVDISAAYVNSKVPFAFDYVDFNSEGLQDITNYHGTHVSGIAAGNEVTDCEGRTLSGVAKDAQLVFMAAGDEKTGGIVESAIIAALEDAVKLHADVVNMSFGSNGEHYEDTPFDKAVRNAEQAGVIICMAAGNEGKTAPFGEPANPLNPDGCALSNIADELPVLLVASADNTYTEHYHTFKFGEELIPYSAIYRMESSVAPMYLGDELAESEYEVKFWENGLPMNEEDTDVEGKIVLFSCDMVPFFYVVETAASLGAAGLVAIYYDGMVPAAATVDAGIPACMVSHEDGDKLINAYTEGARTLTLTDETIDMELPAGISSFSSWGTHQSLELRPDIMGIGGNVESASYYGGQAVISGTSMSTPYLCGCTALVTQYLKENGLELTDAEKSRFIRNLLMNAAVPYETDGIYASPRQQGAGFVSVNNAASAKVLMTGPDGLAKLSLRDQLGDTFSFDVTLTNLSDEDVTFSTARLALTTDGWSYNEEFETNQIDGQITLNATADTDALLTIEANSSRTETITVSLDPDQTAEISSVFENGFFAEGYLLLEGAENTADISIPLLGFYGDWTAAPVLYGEPQLNTAIGNTSLIGGHAVLHDAALIKEILSRVPEEEREESDLLDLFWKYAEEEEQDKLFEATDTCIVSPNHDGLGDDAILLFSGQRCCLVSGLEIYNADGTLAAEGFAEDVPFQMPYATTTLTAKEGALYDLPEGEYTGRFSAHINYPGAEEHPYVGELPLIIDKTAPQITSKVRTENGRTILTLTASDDELDGIVVHGTGKGGIVGTYDPETAPDENLEALDILQNTIMFIQLPVMVVPEETDTEKLSLPAKIIGQSARETDYADVNFAEIIPAEPDENGKFTVEYDITDFTSYCFTAFDRALNSSVYESEPVPAETIEAGIWQSKTSFWAFTEADCCAKSISDGTETAYTYTLTDGTLTLKSGKTVRKASVSRINSQTILLTWEDGSLETLHWFSEGTFDGFTFYPTEQIKEMVVDHFNTNYGPVFEIEITRADIVLTAENMVRVILWGTYDGMDQPLAEYDVELLTGDGVDPLYSPFSIELILNPLAKGIWFGVQEGTNARYIQLSDDGVGRCRALEDGEETGFTYSIEDNCLTMTNEFNQTSSAKITPFDREHAMLMWEDGTSEMLTYKTDSDFTDFVTYTAADIREMAAFDYELKNGEKPASTETAYDETGAMTVTIYDEDMEVLDSYTIDPVTGTGTDEAGEEVDLPQTGNRAVLPAASCTLGILMMLAGAAFVCKSGIFSRKKELF